jgi:hypothetical protein
MREAALGARGDEVASLQEALREAHSQNNQYIMDLQVLLLKGQCIKKHVYIVLDTYLRAQNSSDPLEKNFRRNSQA